MDFVKLDDCYSMVPDEIFIHIFTFLELEDRQNVRLSCRHFYELCDDSLIQSTEVIALHGKWNTVPALHCLSRSSRKIQNIKLRRMHLNTETVEPFFKQHGPHLRSIKLVKCSIDRGALKVMIEHCEHLRRFAMVNILGGYETVLKDLEDLVHNSIVRDYMTDFSLNLSLKADSITNQNILHFFAVFPRISKLNLNIYIEEEGFWRRAFDRMNSSDISSCLSTIADQLEVLNWSFGKRVPDNFFNIPMKNLKQLSVSSFNDLSDIPPMHSSLFERLTHFSCSIEYFGEVESRYPFVQRLLQFAPLQSLTIRACKVMDRQLFKALVESKLKSLVIGCIFRRENSLSVRDLENTEPSSLKNTLMLNYSLQHLVIEYCDSDLASLFSTFFPSVNHLHFSELNECVLQNILDDQTTIRSLQLRNLTYNCIKELPYYQDCLRKVSTNNRELRYLTKLKIKERKSSPACFLLSEFVLPKLKKLTLVFSDKLYEHETEQLFDFILKLPQLQSLDIRSPSEITYRQWLRVCEGSNKLRHFHVRDVGNFFDLSKYVRLFDLSPPLRTIEHHSSTRNLSRYLFYDAIEKTVLNSAKRPW